MKEMTNWRVRSVKSDKSSWSAGRRNSLGSWFQRQGDAWRKERLLNFREAGEKGLRHLKNECYDWAEHRWDYIDMKAEWWWGLCTREKEFYSLAVLSIVSLPFSCLFISFEEGERCWPCDLQRWTFISLRAAYFRQVVWLFFSYFCLGVVQPCDLLSSNLVCEWHVTRQPSCQFWSF